MSEALNLTGDASYAGMAGLMLWSCYRRDCGAILVCGVNMAVWLTLVIWVRLAAYPLDWITFRETNILAGLIGLIFLASMSAGLARRHKWT